MSKPGTRTYRFISALVFITAVLLLPARAATDIETVTSKAGVTAWLVEEHSLPLITLVAGFKGGSAYDPPGREGLANMLTGLMDEGAGDMESRDFQARLEELSIRLSFNADRDHITLSLSTLTKNRAAAFKLLRLALLKPRFDAAPVEKIRSQILTGIKRRQTDPDSLSINAWFKAAFGDHPYAHPLSGTGQSVNAITADDLHKFAKNVFTLESIKISVVGDITPAQLKKELSAVFDDLPEAGRLPEISQVNVPNKPILEIIEHDIPQSVVVFGNKGLKREHPDFIPAYVLNYIIGGGGFSSILTEEVREKKGLAYSVYSYLFPLKYSGLYLGGVATDNARVKQSLDLIRAQLKKIASTGVSDKQLQDAKTYLTGSYALRFDSNAKIANILTAIQQQNLGLDYIKKRNGLINQVTQDNIRRAAQWFLDPANMIVIIVGQPQGLAAVGSED